LAVALAKPAYHLLVAQFISEKSLFLLGGYFLFKAAILSFLASAFCFSNLL